MLETTDLVLTVERQVPGELVTNALKIQDYVRERVKDYVPEKYFDDAGIDAAKKDRAVLNAAAKALNDRRLALEREFMVPFDDFKVIIKQTVEIINGAAAKLDEIVKATEETMRNEKKRDIETLFASKSFALLPLDRIFDPKWLNKGTSMKDVDAQMTAKIQAIYSDIQVIEDLPGDPADIQDAKAQYLETLSIGTVLATAKRLRENRERLAEEERTRAERVHGEHIEAQAHELAVDAAKEARAEPARAAVAEALDIDIDPCVVFVCEIKCTRAQLMNLRKYMTDEGIEYKKLEGVA